MGELRWTQNEAIWGKSVKVLSLSACEPRAPIRGSTVEEPESLRLCRFNSRRQRRGELKKDNG